MVLVETPDATELVTLPRSALVALVRAWMDESPTQDVADGIATLDGFMVSVEAAEAATDRWLASLRKR